MTNDSPTDATPIETDSVVRPDSSLARGEPCVECLREFELS
jgi:hypothetical protein